MRKEQFKQLYDFCQTQTPYIKRSLIQEQLRKIFPDEPFVVMFDHGLDPNVTKGYFLSSKNTDHQFVKNGDRNAIVLSKHLNQCWERFVTVKEMMHLFDDDEEITDTAEKFSTQLAELDGSTPNTQRSPQMVSEIRCFWMVLACLCPEGHRLAFEQARKNNETDDYAIAVQLKIPAQHVPSLFRDDFLKIVGLLIR